MTLRILATLFAVFCVLAVSGCCQKEKKPVGKPAPSTPAEMPAETPDEPEEAETSVVGPLDFDDPTDLDVDVQIGEEDEGAEGPGLDEDITVE